MLSYRYKKERSVAFKIRQNPFSAEALPRPRWGAHDAPHRPPSRLRRGNCLLCILYRVFLFYPRSAAHFFTCTVCSKKVTPKIEITITATNLIRIKYPLSSLNYHLSGANVANFNKIHCIVFEQKLFKKWSSKTEISNMEKSP